MAPNLQETWHGLATRLAPHSASASLDAQVLLAHITGRPRAWLLAHPEEALTPNQQADIEIAEARLFAGEPLPYVIGRWEFYGLEFEVGPAALIPRPETELLVEQALRWLANQKATPLRAVDIGTGSGCIATSLAVKNSRVQVTAVDLSWDALHLARRNTQRHNVSQRIHLLQADLLSAFPPAHSFDLICANLPYIPSATLATLAALRHEPRMALDGGSAGLDTIGRLLDEAPVHLAIGGLALLEIESSQGEAVISLARQSFPQAEVYLLPDLAGHDRLVGIQT